VFPSLQVLDGKSSRRSLPFLCMLRLVDGVERMRMSAQEHSICDILNAGSAVAIDIFDRTDPAK
jgi:hypothetical protein